MGQFKDIDTLIRQLVDDKNIHPSIREAIGNATQPTPEPETYVYVLLCDGVVTDVFTDKAMAMYDLYTCMKADEEENIPSQWTVVKRQLTTTTLP